MNAAKVRKKIPKQTTKRKVNRKLNGKKVHAMHPVVQSQYIREDKPPTPLMEFIKSCEGEGLEYLDLIREFQAEWCKHPKNLQEVSSTLYRPGEGFYRHTLKCLSCGILRTRMGRAPRASR